jgi:hypothetical protein
MITITVHISCWKESDKKLRQKKILSFSDTIFVPCKTNTTKPYELLILQLKCKPFILNFDTFPLLLPRLVSLERQLRRNILFNLIQMPSLSSWTMGIFTQLILFCVLGTGHKRLVWYLSEYKTSLLGLEIYRSERERDRDPLRWPRDTLYLQKLALTYWPVAVVWSV